MVIFVRDFYPKRKEDLVCVVREQPTSAPSQKKYATKTRRKNEHHGDDDDDDVFVKVQHQQRQQ